MEQLDPGVLRAPLSCSVRTERILSTLSEIQPDRRDWWRDLQSSAFKSTSAKAPCPAASAKPMPERAGMFITITDTKIAVNETIVPTMMDENTIQPPSSATPATGLHMLQEPGLPV